MKLRILNKCRISVTMVSQKLWLQLLIYGDNWPLVNILIANTDIYSAFVSAVGIYMICFSYFPLDAGFFGEGMKINRFDHV